MLAARRTTLADRWRRGMAGTTYVPLSAGELRELFLSLTDTVVAAILGDVDSAQVGQQIGASLVEAGYTANEALGGTLNILVGDLLAWLPRRPRTSCTPP